VIEDISGCGYDVSGSVEDDETFDTDPV